MTDKKSKLAAGSIITLLGSIILRFGGFIYRFILSRLLSTSGYGIVGLTLPFQNMFIIGASGGIPPAIAKYVSQHKALDEKEMVHRVTVTGMKMMIFFSLIAAILMFLISEPIAIGVWNKPEALLPLRLVSVIVPFSVIVGSFRGVFQGFYQMKNIFYSKFIEQVFTIIIASALVIIGWYAAGAVLGTALGFLVSLFGSYYLFRKDIQDAYLNENFPKVSFKEELELMKQILKFSIPVVISGIAEIFLYDTGTFFIGMFLPTFFAGFYTNASAIARIPLILANSVSMSVLPATSEADSLKDKELLKMYMHQSYRYTTLTSLPVSAFIMVYAVPMMILLFGRDYAQGAEALWILVLGMFFFSIYLISCSMCQGLGKPTFPMYALIIGAIINAVLSFLLVPLYNISGAAIATTVATFILMLLTIIELVKLSSIHPPYKDLLKMFVATGLMIFVMYLIPHTIIGMFIGLVLGTIVYIIVILLLKAIKSEDVVFIEHFVNKTGPLKKYLIKIVELIKIYLK
ncbi:flippase [Methanosphaera sp. ISO3-F5]|uniref:flippase n=1 Tax=Methanosphaera sp. ISO3-F5 TaxID=1452353 RepID=UPI002B25A963|nr:flippase [Methanosphaera sp. ISO3-F5]WQH64117.1 flippase [Methanosphaera sp. ISO3-F5]